MSNLQTILSKIAEVELDFVVVGGFAGVLHGSSYVTDHLDICIVMSAENLEKLRQAFGEINPVHRMTSSRLSFLRHPPRDTPVANLYLETDAGNVNVRGSVMGVGEFETFARNAVTIELFGFACRVLTLPDLIKAKEARGREIDLLVAKELRAIAVKRLSSK